MTTSEIDTRALLHPVTQTRTIALVRDRWVLTALGVLALALRVPNLGRAYWVDEGISVGIASHPLSQLPKLLREDGSPPLFYVLLHVWMRLFGRSEAATHSLPLLISLCAVPVAYWCATDIFDRRAGLGAAALVATNPFLNWYATETRMYTLVIVLSMLAVTFAWRSMRDRRPSDAAACVVFSAALLYTHDWGIYLVGSLAVVMFWLAWRQGDRTLAMTVVGCGVAVGILWAPWVPSFLFQAGNTAAPWAVQPGIGDFFADPASALGGTLGFFIAPLLAVGAYACSAWPPARDNDPHPNPARILATVALASTVAGFLGAEVDPSWTVRYLAIIVGPYLLAAGGALATSRRGRAVLWTACGALTLWSAVGTLLPNANARYAKDNMAAVASGVAPLLHPGDAVIVTQTEQVPVAYHYLPSGLSYLNPMGPVTDPTVVDWRNIVDRLQSASPCLALGPTLDALTVGTDVLEINPVRELGASGSAWARAVNGQVLSVDNFLAADPAFTPVDIYRPSLQPKPFSPVDGVLYRKTSAVPSCS